MLLAYVIVAAVLSLALVVSGAGKLRRAQQIVDSLTGIGVPLRLFPFLAACEFAGAAGLIAGIWWAPLGIAAAIGVVLYFLLAVGAHVRKKDLAGMPPATFLLFLAAAALVLRFLSL
ncbi:hypothetical protein FHX82_001205 [Amycolatopsis bartoniae]|uniref:DoxX family protein n=1 Tax=Amycolatopsis bartoniae TaxID=941986 RepID=A0A8H9J273_9PSEU|nr:DoxX family protein [Amycolatopsis bartoniae]MBB2934185.1 hypothetical protein [Amycolatopsis bartoniae]TVT08702.1 DoxX family protein [Amycolatopsis bartoniae]GHF88615.1 hypothetical protein GCM10017566_72930 [Amycolatopsis bartoniae]